LHRRPLESGFLTAAPFPVAAALLILFLLAPQAHCSAEVSVADVPGDGGGALVVSWDGEFSGADSVLIERRGEGDAGWTPAATVRASAEQYVDSGLERGRLYAYRLSAPGDPAAGTFTTGQAAPRASWFAARRFNQFAIFVLYFAAVVICIRLAARGWKFFVRRIAGLRAIEEAIGRATEMGRPVLYVPGIDDMNNIQTIASMVILNDVARIAATYETPVIVPVCRPFVVPVAEEAVQQGYLNAGRPELYKPDTVRYLSDVQFAFTAGVSGIMLREKTAANLYLGSFFAESLVLAETGFATGAIQVAGTANIHQLPFFVAACDYTLIGEELFAASAYLSNEPMLVGTLKASDIAKIFIIGAIIAGVIAQTAGWEGFAEWFTPR
jgi:hypothetical protein